MFADPSLFSVLIQPILRRARRQLVFKGEFATGERTGRGTTQALKGS